MNKEQLARKWRNYTIIKKLTFESDLGSETYECNLKIVLCKDAKKPKENIKINFFGVSNLKLGEIGGGISQLCRLDVIDIKERQWDRLNYYVFDYESEKISFNQLLWDAQKPRAPQ